MNRAKYILPVIIISQFFCTSLWFAGNGVLNDLILNFSLTNNAVGHLTSAVQFGFITGTLLFAVLTLSDRFSPSKVFLTCAILGAVSNTGLILETNTPTSIIVFRFFTGFFLAGIYPVGMKIAADYYEKGLGRSLGFLVGALVVGTALPHLLKDMTHTLPWISVLILTSILAVVGGILIAVLVPDGPFRQAGQKFYLPAFLSVFKNRDFRTASFGYFGHMWELYAFWTLVPIMLKSYTLLHPNSSFNIPLLSFLIIGVGGLACALGGVLAQRYGTKRIAFISLLLSCICCLISPLLFQIGNEEIFIGFLLFWGMAVIADSPLFSTMVAHSAVPELKGTALTIVNCIGFAITIISIQLITGLIQITESKSIFVLLGIGPILGLIALKRNKTLV